MAQLVIADTGPLHYLRLIDQVELLPQLFMTVHIPVAVHMELSHSAAPKIVREWISEPPSWLLVQPDPAVTLTLRKLGAGEHAAIALAVQLEAGLLLTDDRAAVKAARAHGFVVTGTLGVLIPALIKIDPRRASPPLRSGYWIHTSGASVCAAVLGRVKARCALRP